MDQIPAVDAAFCAKLDPTARKPSTLPLDQYESRPNDFIGNYCRRRLKDG